MKPIPIVVAIAAVALLAAGLVVGYADTGAYSTYGQPCGSAFAPDSLSLACDAALASRRTVAVALLVAGGVAAVGVVVLLIAAALTRPDPWLSRRATRPAEQAPRPVTGPRLPPATVTGRARPPDASPSTGGRSEPPATD